jgi:hypothetical protein
MGYLGLAALGVHGAGGPVRTDVVGYLPSTAPLG